MLLDAIVVVSSEETGGETIIQVHRGRWHWKSRARLLLIHVLVFIPVRYNGTGRTGDACSSTANNVGHAFEHEARSAMCML